MRYLAFVSLLLCLASCHKKAYLNKQEITPVKPFTAKDFRPVFEKALYRCEVDGKFLIKKFHLSGILYLKTLEDKSTRVIFQSEMGATLFDFGWDANDSFKVYAIIDQMNKPALIKTLKKDFELLLVKNIPDRPTGYYNLDKNPDLVYTQFALKKGTAYYVVYQGKRLMLITNADDKQKNVVSISPGRAALGSLSDLIEIRHLKAHFTIRLRKITPDNVEE